MAWIESHTTLGHHAKTIALAAAWRKEMPTVVGHLHYLWWWALHNTSSGTITGGQRDLVARACWWRGKTERFWDGLLVAGFVEETGEDHALRVHDWMDYAGRLLDSQELRRESNRRAQSAHRQRLRQHLPSADVSAESALTVSTRQQPTGPNLTGPLTSSSSSSPEGGVGGTTANGRRAAKPILGMDFSKLPPEMQQRLAQQSIAERLRLDEHQTTTTTNSRKRRS